MKHIITAAIAAMAISSQAASFMWSAGSVVQFDGTTLAGNATGYLVYLGTGDSISASDLFTVDYTAPGTITTADAAQSKDTSTGRTAGRISSVTYKDELTGDDGHHVYTGAKFGMFIKYNDGKKDWYNFSDTIATITTDATGAFEAKTFSFAFDNKTEITSSSQSVSAGSGWYSISVPEPSVAFMGLLGIGMLIRRRKA